MVNRQRNWQRLSLRWRLLLLNLTSAGLCLGIFTYISHFYKQDAFFKRIHNANEAHLIDRYGDEEEDVPIILALFHEVNNQGTILGIAIASTAVGGLAYWFSGSLHRTLSNIEQAVERFNAGDYSARAPLSSIREIDRLCLTLNGAAARLQNVEERRQILVGDLSHEIGTPLTVIKGYLELARDNRVELTSTLITELLEESNRMHRLLNDLQLISKVEAGNLPLHLQSFNPAPIIERLVNTFTLQCQEAGKTLTWQSNGTVGDLYADPDRFSQILANLISNAIRYTSSGGKITVSGYFSNRHYWFSVADTGIGMTAEELPFVFDRFWRSKTAKGMKNDGSGLGLAIAKRLVEMQGGKIEAECEINRGCTFRFTLPLT